MSAQASITAFDGAATPVTHTFVGEGIERMPDGSLVARWKESLAGVPDYAQIRITGIKKKLPSGVFIVTVRAEVPVMEAIAGQNASGYTAPPKVAYVDTVDVVGKFHERSVVTGRRLARQLAINIAGSVSTSVAPVTTGPFPELMDQLIQAT
jgi:hypothetical protein